MKIVINASPLILLCNCKLEFILPELFEEIIVPEAVWDEIVAGPEHDQSVETLPHLSWLKKLPTSLEADIANWDLGNGESSVLSHACVHPEFIAVLDDMQAKKCAKAIGIKTLGTGSILIAAKQKGLIDSVEDSLRQLQKAGLWISEAVIQMLKAKANE